MSGKQVRELAIVPTCRLPLTKAGQLCSWVHRGQNVCERGPTSSSRDACCQQTDSCMPERSLAFKTPLPTHQSLKQCQSHRLWITPSCGLSATAHVILLTVTIHSGSRLPLTEKMACTVASKPGGDRRLQFTVPAAQAQANVMPCRSSTCSQAGKRDAMQELNLQPGGQT